MDSKIKKLVAGVALAGALTVGTAGVAVAADGNGGTATDPSAQPARRHPGLRAEIRKGAVKVVTETLGVSRQELRAALQGGQTISEYATSLGKDPQAVVDALDQRRHHQARPAGGRRHDQAGAGRHGQEQAPGPDRQADEPPVRPARQRADRPSVSPDRPRCPPAPRPGGHLRVRSRESGRLGSC